MMRRACVIFVPHSGQSDADRDLNHIQTCLTPSFDLEVWSVSSATNIADLTRNAVAEGFDCIIASGGDGTVSAVAGALCDRDIPLGIIPRGTVNALAKELQIPLTIPAACETIASAKTRRIDMARCNEHPFVTSIAIGFEAEAVAKADSDLKKTFGPLAYVAGQIQEIAEGWPQFTATLALDNRPAITLHAAAVTVANAAPIISLLAQGGDRARLDDSQLDITVLDPENLADAIASAWDLWQTGRQEKVSQHPHIHFWRAQSLKITTDPPQNVMLDGDPFGKTPVAIECFPRQLLAIVP
jgi:YegS/Rv2252/BmrU family lipid kinase